MVNEVVKNLVTGPDSIYVDGTVGSGGHSLAIGEKISRRGCLICLDRDEEAVKISRERLSAIGGRVIVLKSSYTSINKILQDLNFHTVDGIFLDLGVSSIQLEGSGRGFSFKRDEPLDMRMDLDEEITAQQLINMLSLTNLEKILRDYGEEKKARSIARAIVRERRKRGIDSSLQLSDLIKSTVSAPNRSRKKHPATRTFQALRIAVNRELENLRLFLEKAPSMIAKKGRLVIISYHSLEDRMVKRAMVDWERACSCPPDIPRCTCKKITFFRRLNKKGVKPGLPEIQENPRARSAVLRAAERI